jgi:hypothetical protein
VDLVRAAGLREIDEQGLELTLKIIQRKAAGEEVDGDAVFEAAATG